MFNNKTNRDDHAKKIRRSVYNRTHYYRTDTELLVWQWVAETFNCI